MSYTIEAAQDGCYPGTTVLVNKFGLHTQKELNAVESVLVTAKTIQWSENPRCAAFDFEHYKAIHRHLFGELYDWAGQVRMVNLSKKGTQFCPVEEIPRVSAAIFKRLAQNNLLCGLARNDFIAALVDLYQRTNELHPFREGNGRTQRVFLSQLAENAGYDLDFTAVDPDELMIATIYAAQGIEAQTLANVYLALDHDLEVIPVLNKIDLPSADPERVAAEIEDVIGLDAEDAPLISAKNGLNIEQVLEQIVKKIPAPSGSLENPLQALIFDSLYDPYKGVIVFFRIMEGQLKKGTKVRMMATGAEFDVVEVGYFGAGQFIPSEDGLSAGMVGYLTASIKNVKDTRVGDTITDAANPCAKPLPGYKKVNPMVYCGLYPADGAKYPDLRDALEKLQLNDASLFYEPETSIALGFGFRCGFLGLLHLEIIQERLEREYNLDLVTTAPGVVYRVHKTNGEVIELTNPSNLPDPSMIEYMEEPVVSAEIMVTTDYIGSIMELCQERRGQYLGMEYMEETRALLKYELPLNEIIYDFFDALKSRSKGYASFDYELKGYEQSELVKLDILINREEVDALSFIVHKDSAYERGRKMCEKLKDEIPRHLFEIPIQAAVGSKIIARETVKAMRKDVLAKCYGGDISRKKKLLEKQKEGKKRMRQVGNVEIPQKAFMSVLKLDEN